MREKMVVLATLAVLLTLGCGGGNDSPTSPSTNLPPTSTTQNPQSTTPTTADVTVLVSDGLVSNSPVPGKRQRVTFLVTIRESAGVDCHINYFRMDIWDRIGAKERDEITAGMINATFGGNKIHGGSAWQFRVPFDVNLVDVRTWRLTTGITDANGHAWDFVVEGVVTSMKAPLQAVRTVR